MTMTYWPHVALIGWACAGLAFWIDCLRWNGLPDSWYSVSRNTGWVEALFVWLPLMVLGGPLWWIALSIVRWVEK